MMNNRDRTELRLLLHQHKLLFLRPKYREEHLIEEDKGLLQFFHFYPTIRVHLSQHSSGVGKNSLDSFHWRLLGFELGWRGI